MHTQQDIEEFILRINSATIQGEHNSIYKPALEYFTYQLQRALYWAWQEGKESNYALGDTKIHMNTDKILEQYKVFECIAGSRAYGLSTPESDTDIRGVFVEPMFSCMGLFPVEQINDATQDKQYYSLRKFVKLAMDNNPNIIELLFTPEENVIMAEFEMLKFRHHKDWFLSQKAKHTFTGYAVAQLKRITGHRKWLMNPQPAEMPQPQSYMKTKGFTDTIANDIGGDVEFLNKGNTTTTFFDKDAYLQAHKKWKQYWEWKNNRNEKRAEMEAESGFDRKHAMHLVRLLHMGEEILSKGEVIVKRPDAEFLLDIRNGKYSYEYIVDYAEKKLAEIENIKPVVPYKPEINKINEYLVDLQFAYYKQNQGRDRWFQEK